MMAVSTACLETRSHAANDAISNATAALAMFDQYDIGGMKHSSSDGQRTETQIPTINARYGSKYFGLKKIKTVVAWSVIWALAHIW